MECPPDSGELDLPGAGQGLEGAQLDAAVERLAALEQQQKVDHDYFVRIRETLEQLQRDAVSQGGKVKDIEANQNNHLQVGVQIRRELYGVRDNLQGEINKVNVMLQDTVQPLRAPACVNP